MKFTIFTPTYNRARLLLRVYKSLIKQKDRDFEWIIVDDGSTDDTEQVVSSFMAEHELNIRYIKKINGGKHTAHNLAVKNAAGEWFMCLDSDDMLVDNAIEILRKNLECMYPSDCGIIGGKVTLDGKRLSGQITQTGAHYGLYGYCHSCGGYGEYALLFKSDILRNYLFPEISGEYFMGENVVYDGLELDGYTMAVTNEIIQLCEYQEEGLTSKIYQSLFKNPTAYQIYHMQRIDLVISIKERIRHAIQYQTFRRISKKKYYQYRGKHQLLVFLSYIPGIMGEIYYRKRRQAC